MTRTLHIFFIFEVVLDLPLSPLPLIPSSEQTLIIFYVFLNRVTKLSENGFSS